MATYFVTGANGFIGQHLLWELSHQGHKILALSRRQSKHLKSSPQVEWVYADLNDVESYRDALKGVDFVVHLAGLLNARRKEEYDWINVQGTMNLLNACEKTRTPSRRFLHMSSIAVMGPSYDGNLLKESQECRPETEYGKSKLKAERAVVQYSSSIPVVILRPSFVYGSGDLRGLKALTSVINQPGISWLSFTGTVSLCYISDLIRAILLSLEKDLRSGELFIISDPHFYTREDIANALLNSLRGLPVFEGANRSACSIDQPVTPYFSNLPTRTMNRLQHWGCDITQARIKLGFEPKVFLKEGAFETIQWYFKEGLLDANFLKGGQLQLREMI